MDNNLKEAAIRQHMERTFIPRDEAEKRWEGLVQFLNLCKETKTEEVASDPIDELWHDALLFTEDYREFCLQNFGKVIEHRPATIPGKASGYLVTRKKAEAYYGKLPNFIWPIIDRPRWSIGYVK